MNKSLSLHEEVLLLAFQDQKGTIDHRAGSFLNVLAGAMLAELLLTERIRIAKERNKLIDVIDKTPVEDPVINKALDQIKSAKRRKNIQGWVTKLASTPSLKESVAIGLCKKGILKQEEKEILLFFKKKIYPEVDPKPEKQLLQRVEKAIFSNQQDVDIRTAILISLSYKSNLLSIPFSNKDLRKNKKRIEKIIKGEHVGKATSDAIKAIQDAAAIAAIVPIIMVSGASSSC